MAPVDGGVLAQSATFVDAMEVIGREIGKHQQEQLKQAEEKNRGR